MSRLPDSGAVTTLPAGTPARVIGRSGAWVRVQVEGWVPEADVKPAQAGVLAGITAAEVRATPEKFVGQTLDWRLQIIAVQLADELRPEMPSGQPYLLTRGPLPEAGFVYVMIPPDRVAEFRALAGAARDDAPSDAQGGADPLSRHAGGGAGRHPGSRPGRRMSR